MKPNHPDLSWKLTSPTAVLTLLLGAFMLFISIYGVLDPAGAAAGFGLPLSGTEAIPWMHVKAGRDLGVGLALFALVAIRQRQAAGVFVFACLVMPTVDALTAMHEGGTSLAMALAVHGSAAAYGVVLAFALLRRRPV